MVLSRNFCAPGRIIFGGDLLENLARAMDGRPWSLVTNGHWMAQDIPDRLAGKLGPAISVIGNIPSNPTETVIKGMAERETGDVVIALGGGSVMDAAKAFAPLAALGPGGRHLDDHLRAGTPLPADLDPADIICVPTTSGTGSEVTRWATIWGDDKIKYSLMDPKLYPGYAILQPELCLTMGQEITLSSGLDAASHAMEAVWNRNHTPLSDQLAGAALGMLHQYLGRSVKDGDDLEARTQVQTAACMAGLAMSTTQTALCHSISYPFTSLFAMPHGLACSFTLGAVARFNLEADPLRLDLIVRALGAGSAEELPARINAWLAGLGLGKFLAGYVNLAHLEALDENLITRSRAGNNIRGVTGAAAKALARQGLQEFL